MASQGGSPAPAPAKKSTTTKVAAKAVKVTPQGRAASIGMKAASATKKAPKKAAGAAYGKVPAKARKWLLAELIVCVLLLVLSGMTGTASADGSQTDTGSRLAVKGSALAGVFIVLGLVSSGGKGAEKAAGALGLLITLAYVFNERDVFTTLSGWAKEAAKP